MSAPSNMTCERCSELITELVCGELDAASESAVRAHAEQCPDCSPMLARFSRVLSVAESIPLEEPSVAVQQRIMQAAREAVSRRAGSAVAIDSGTPVTGFKAWLEKLGTWAMSPQVAMASVLLLVVGIGLYALPLGTDPNASTSLQLAQEPAAEAAKTAPVASAVSAPVTRMEPATPAAEAPADQARLAEPRQPISAERDQENAPAEKAKADFADSELKRRAASGPVHAKSAGKKEAGGAGLDEFSSFGAGGAATGRSLGGGDKSSDDLLEGSGNKGDSPNAANAGPSKQGKFAPPPPVVDTRRNDPGQAYPYREAEPEPAAQASAAQAEEARASTAAPPPAPSKPSAKDAEQQKLQQHTTQNQLNEGIKAAQNRDYARAIELLTPIANSQPTARLWLARSLRARGQCDQALAYYGPLASSANASQAVLQETADCYERVGQTSQATSMRARARPAQQQAAPPKAATTPSL